MMRLMIMTRHRRRCLAVVAHGREDRALYTSSYKWHNAQYKVMTLQNR